MQQTNQLMSNAIEMQQNALDIGQEALDQAVEIPLKQSIEFQKSAGKLFLNGLEMSSWLGNRSAELTREALDTYFQTVDSAAENATQMTEQGIKQASDFGHEQLQTQQQQFQPGGSARGQQSAGFQQSSQAQPTFSRGSQPPQAGTQQPMPQSPPMQQSAPQPPVENSQMPPAGQQPPSGPSGQQIQQPAGQQMQQPPVQHQPQPAPVQESPQPAPQQVQQPSSQQPTGQQVQQPAGQQIQQPPVQHQTQPAPVQESPQPVQGQPQPTHQSGRQLAVAGGVPDEESGNEAPVDNT